MTIGKQFPMHVDASGPTGLAKSAMGVEPALQNEHSGDLIDDIFSVARSATGGVEMAMGLGGAEAFIPQVDGKSKLRAQAVSKSFRSDGSWTAIA